MNLKIALELSCFGHISKKMLQKLAVMLQQRELRDKKRKQKHKIKRRRELRDKKRKQKNKNKRRNN
jgi:hypothetical protein